MKLPSYLIVFVAIAALFATAYCGQQHDESASDDSTNIRGDDSAEGDDADDDDDDDSDSPYNVVEKEDLGASWQCAYPAFCIGDYLDFLGLAQPYADPITKEELNRRIADVENGRVEVLTEPMSEDALDAAITDILNIGFLQEGINERLLVVTTIRKEETADYYEKELLFSDPNVGEFEGILLVPKGEGPFPGIVAIHGHRGDAQRYMNQFYGREYPVRGYALLMLTMRAMGIEWFEHYISREFLLDGFTLVGMRSYETLLGLKYLRYLDIIEDDHIGLIGHSGGSSACNLTVRVEHGFAAYVSDLTIDYCEWGTLFEPYHCETVPELYPYNLLIGGFETCSTPILAVPYGYTNGMDEIFAFFDEHLKE